MHRAFGIAIVSGLVLAPVLRAAEVWPGWRGPSGSGVSDDTRLPLHWAPDQNIRWKTAIPGAGFSSPIVWKDRLFCTAAFNRGARRVVHCLDRDTGKLLWSRAIGDKSPEATSAMTGHAAATPVTDGTRVVAFFGNAGAVCYDFQGKQLWQRGFGELETELGLGSSPILCNGKVILLCDHDGDRFSSFDSFLIALDVKTGKAVWRTDRRGLFRSWSTPILVPGCGKNRELIVSGQDALRAYDPETGKTLWHVGGMTGWVAPSPVYGSGLIFATCGKNGPTLAVRPGGAGDVSTTRVAWRHKTGGSYVCSPLLYKEELYVVTEKGILTCHDARSGRIHYKERLAGKFTASPVAGVGHVYLTNEEGTTYVIEAGPKHRVVAKNALKEYSLASAALVGGRIFMRTEKHLYCIEGRTTK